MTRRGTAFQGGGQFRLLSQSIDNRYRRSLSFLYKGALPSPHFKQRGFVWPFMCSCSCSCAASSSLWRCFGDLTGSLFGLPPHEEGLSAARSTVCSSRAPQTIAPPVASLAPTRLLWDLLLRLCAPGARSKAGGEPPSGYPPKASLVPTDNARTSGSPKLTSTRWSEMANMVVLSRSRRSVVRPATPRSVLDAILRCTI